MATEITNPLVYQLRYYGPGNPKNFPSEDDNWYGASSDLEQNKNILSNFGSVIKLGIQTLPGVIFYLNGNFSSGIIIDHTGVYELDLRNTTTAISSLTFSVESLKRIREMDNASIIVDILCNPSQGVVNS